MSGPHTEKIEELLRQRALIDQLILGLQILNGDRVMPPATSSYTAVQDQPQRALPAADVKTRGQHIVRRRRQPGAPPDGLRSKLAREQDAIALELLAQAGVEGLAPAALRKKLRLAPNKAQAVFHRLKQDGRLKAVGTGRGTRYVGVPKEAP